MPSDVERSVALRRFSGVNRQVDSAFLGGDELLRADNFVPGKNFLIRKRFGNANFLTNASATGAGKALLRVYAANGDRLLYQVAQASGPGSDTVYLSTNDAAFAAITTASTFTTVSTIYGITQFNRKVYIGNDTDPVKVIDIDSGPSTATDLAALASFTDNSDAPDVTAAGASQVPLVTGTYAFAWARYDSVLKRWTGRATARTFTLTAQNSVITFNGITTALGANELYHLFVAPVNLPVEFAHDHTPQGIAAAATTATDVFVLNEVTTSSVPLPTSNAVLRRGNILVAHRGRLWLAGSSADRRLVAATNVIVPGTESALFDQGEFFPVNAVGKLVDVVTGMGVGTTGATRDSPVAPMVMFTRTKTFMFFGDIVDDPSALLVEVSGNVGCISHRTIVNTPAGLIWAGERSVYLLRGANAEVIDIGWPIAPEIEQIPELERIGAAAIYHKGFYKLSYSTGATAGQNDKQLWLDLRVGFEPPSWWGPHTVVVTLGMMTNAERDGTASETDRAFGLQQFSPPTRVVVLDQENVFQDVSNGYDSVLETPAVDFGLPFERKIFTRIRSIGRPVSDAETLSLSVATDDGVAAQAPPLVFDSVSGGVWNTAVWDVATWTDSRFVEAESVFADDRPRGQSIRVIMTHTAARGIELRDFELRYRPVERPVA